MHLAPSFGKGRAVGEAIINTMYPAHDNGRIPVVAVAGTNGKTTTVRLIAHLLGSKGLRVGMTNPTACISSAAASIPAIALAHAARAAC